MIVSPEVIVEAAGPLGDAPSRPIKAFYNLCGYDPSEESPILLSWIGDFFLSGGLPKMATCSESKQFTVCRDFWGIAKSHPECYTPKGVSSVFVNTDKGNELLSILQRNGRVEKATLQEGLVKQGNLVRPSGRPVCRDHFYDHIDDPDFIDNMKVGLKMKERVKTLLPAGVVNMLKRM